MLSSSPAMRNHPLPLVFVCLLSIRGPLPSASAGTGMPPNGPILPTEDYDRLDEDTTVAPVRQSTHAGPLQRCDYHPCREKQTLCEVLAASSGCLCPGLTLHDRRPEPPKLSSVSWNGSAVVVRWCAPNSHVKNYVVTIGGEEMPLLANDRRSAALEQIDGKAEVCVTALNNAGGSERSCMEYQPSSSSLPLTAGLIGGALGLLLLILLVALLCRRRRLKKQETRHV
uniref:Epidermal growth factor receptor-like transmembrane-juxtamembrane segment domain-containing protein n=1 Tax=Fundulus heteroclitus TaxID=8078 RepID=A0A3Q2U2I0_FUNHE